MDYKIVIDPGHGGDDPGASGNGIIEKNLNLNISNYMFNRFKELGIPVSITRNSDITLNPTDRVNKILSFYGDDPSVIVISNHINAGGGDGAEVIYALRNGDELSNLVISELQKEGQNIRKVYQRRLPSNNSRDYYFIHRDTGNTEPIIVEYGFLDSSKDDVNQLKNNYENYAEAVVRGVLEYINYSLEPVVDDNKYVVKKGDTLWSIAKKYGVSVDSLKQINNLDSNLLSIGQVLIVKNNGFINNDKYVVKKGDTLYSIAKRFGISVEDIMNYNGLTSSLLSIGDELSIPTGQIVENIIGTNYGTYEVVYGDTLYGIASRYNVSLDKLRSVNNLTSDILSVGQKILIPYGDEVIDTLVTDYIDYKVVSGDTLYSLSRKYDVAINDLRQLNNLSDDNLIVGQIIKIPSKSSIIYTVVFGDTLYSIARKYNVSVDDLRRLNNLSSDILSIGQVLRIN